MAGLLSAREKAGKGLLVIAFCAGVVLGEPVLDPAVRSIRVYLDGCWASVVYPACGAVRDLRGPAVLAEGRR